MSWRDVSSRTAWDVWIGLNDRETEGTWVWESGNQLSPEVAEHWHRRNGQRSEPDNARGKEHCALVGGSELYDDECGRKLPFVCQKRSGAGMYCVSRLLVHRALWINLQELRNRDVRLLSGSDFTQNSLSRQ